MPTAPKSSRFASATNLLPGPTTMSAGLPVNSPKASVAIACTPPSVRIMSAPPTIIACSTPYRGEGIHPQVLYAMKVGTPAALAVPMLM